MPTEALALVRIPAQLLTICAAWVLPAGGLKYTWHVRRSPEVNGQPLEIALCAMLSVEGRYLDYVEIINEGASLDAVRVIRARAIQVLCANLQRMLVTESAELVH